MHTARISVVVTGGASGLGLATADQFAAAGAAVTILDLRAGQASRPSQLGLRPLARIHAMAVASDDPITMLTGPIPATEQVLKRSGMSVASAAWLLTSMLVGLEQTGGRNGLPTMCEAGGTANATIIERL